MPMLIVFILRNILLGATIGLGVAGWLLLGPDQMLDELSSSSNRTLAMLLLSYAMAATFGLGYLATALCLFDGED